MIKAKISFAVITVFAFTSTLYSAANNKSIDFEGAKWIWTKVNTPLQSAGTFYFQKGFSLPAGAMPKTARILITCDNSWTLYINGKEIVPFDPGRKSWRRSQLIDISKNLVNEQNSVAIAATNTIAGPAGLIVKLQVQFEDGKTFELISDESWISSAKKDKFWNETGFTADETWLNAELLGVYGIKPWGKIKTNGNKPVKELPASIEYKKELAFENPIFKDGVVFVRGFLPFKSHDPNNFIKNARDSRAYFEMDPMTPSAIGRQIISLIPFKPDGKLTVLCDAKGGVLGSPSVSYDGKTVYFSLAKKGAAYYHVYAVGVDGKDFRQITDGPFHDYDPVELPDGRIAFSSTRLGSREEYHAKYASALFTSDQGGQNITPLTYHIVADREPRVTANGSLVFIRMDNFLERAKVETHLHQTRPDGTGGKVVIGPVRKAIHYENGVAAESNSNWLRKYAVGSSAPLPDGRIAAINQDGLVTSESPAGQLLSSGFLPYDISPLPDGRLLCTSIHRTKLLTFDRSDSEVKEVVTLADLDLPKESALNLTSGYQSGEFHSVMHLGKRTKPPLLPSTVDPKQARSIDKTGFLYCQNVFNTQQNSADLKRIKAVRIYEGRPFTLEPTKSIYEHIGTVGTELGTVPLAKDGSFYVEVPADRPLAIQAVDGEGRPVINAMSWIYVRPGEQRSCVGCHAPPAAAPASLAAPTLAISKALKLLGQGTPHRFRANNAANGGVLNLQLDRFREVAAINMPVNQAELQTMINNADPDIKLSAIRRMAILRDRGFVPALVTALEKTDNNEIKCAAALSLSACGNRDAVAPLLRMLSDSNLTIQNAANMALEHITGATAMNALTKPDWQTLEKKLINNLSANNTQDVQLAIEALGHIGGANGKQALRQFLSDNKDAQLRVLLATIRSLGHLKDHHSVALLIQILNDNLTKKGTGGHHELGYGQKPIYLSATAAEALGRIGTPSAEKAILEAFGRLNSFQDYTFRTADHEWLMGCHASPLHHRILEALDRMESTAAGAHINKIIESLPSDKDRGLLYELDSFETLSSRVIARSQTTDRIVETCLAVLGDTKSKPDKSLLKSVSLSPHAQDHIREYSPQARAAQILSIVCNDVGYAKRISERLKNYRSDEPSETRSWSCFYLTRTLGRLEDHSSADLLIDMLANDPTEAALGLNPPPTHIIYKGWRPFYRPAAAWSLGMLKNKKAVAILLDTVGNLDNASSTRQEAAIALGKIADPNSLKALHRLGEDYPEVMTRRSILKSIKNISSRD